MSDIAKTLQQRQQTHGDFKEVAATAQAIKSQFPPANKNCQPLIIREGLDMIASKLARICEGNPMNPDHWHDIAGYATLVEQFILSQKGGSEQ